MQRLGRLPLRALAGAAAEAAAPLEGARAASLLLPGAQLHGQAGANGGAAAPAGGQLLMVGSHAVSGARVGAHAHIRDGPGNAGEASPSRTQLHMAGERVTSAPPEASSSSSSEEEAERGVEDLKQRLLAAALKHVKAEGWTAAAVRRGAAELQLSPAAAGVFARPEAELVQFFIDGCNARLRQRLAHSRREFAALTRAERLRAALRWRLEMLVPHMDTWPQALAIHTSPGSLPRALTQVGELVDEVWHAAGDDSADYSWYAKRGALAAAYAATEAFMLTDYSPGYADTWEALDRRLAELEQLGRLSGQVRAATEGLLQRCGVVPPSFGRPGSGL